MEMLRLPILTLIPSYFSSDVSLNTVRTWKHTYKLRVVVFVEYETDVPDESDRVKRLLEKLRIQAELIVVWLASGNLRTYELVVNGILPGPSDDDKRTERVLGQESWWKELQDRRKKLGNTTPAVQIRGVSELMGDTDWPESSFHQLGRTDISPFRRMDLKRLRNSRRHRSISGPAILSVSLNMRAQRLNPDALLHGSGSDSSDDESVASSAASENDINGYSDEEDRNLARPRRASTGDALTARGPIAPSRVASRNRAVESISSHSTGTDTSEGVIPAENMLNPAVARLRLASRPTTPSFSSKAIPDTQIAADDGPGPSIRFVDNEPIPPAKTAPERVGSIPTLSFNDVPSRGQHLILNELMRRYSKDTAVLFTTLPSPPPNSCQSEQDSLSYLEGLEVRHIFAWNLRASH
jgi:potassium/chloride transporter 9